ncbi:hypothetical protein AURDEDRAFT_176320 [Auricularia subglabra TFB-10046 SS5]|nr:hypothetical protein AURDEDRAFT_176320 [Auricularia subglabra TFB-10046 SS5]
MAATTLNFLRNANGDAQFDYTRTTDERLARHVKSEFLNFFPPETAQRARLICPEDRFNVAYPAKGMGLFVPHGILKVVDDVRNCVYVVERSKVTPHGINVASLVHGFLGLSTDQLAEMVQLCTREVPWFESGVPVATALTYVGGLWVPLLNHFHARELGLGSLQRWVIQTDARDLWVRDLATNLTYEVTASRLARGITIRDLIQLPELLNKPGALIKSHTAARDWEQGEDWRVSRPPHVARDFELTTHRYWVWRNQYMPQPATGDRNPLDAFDDSIFALLSLGRAVQEMDDSPETKVGEELPVPVGAPVNTPEQASAGSCDSMPSLVSVSDSSASGSRSSPEQGSERGSDVQSVSPAAAPTVPRVEQPGTWEEYLFSAHGARWLRNHARPRHGQSPLEFYDHDEAAARSA